MSAGEALASLWQPCSPRTWSAVSASGTPCPLLLPPAEKKPKGAVEGWGCAGLSQATAAVPTGSSGNAAPCTFVHHLGQPHTTGRRKRLRAGCKPCPRRCTPGTLLSQTQVGTGPSCPGPCPFSLPWSPKMRSTAHRHCWHNRSPSLRLGMRFYQELVFSPPVSAAPSHQGHERHQPRGPADVGRGRADAGAAHRRGHAVRQGWAKAGLSHPLAVG